MSEWTPETLKEHLEALIERNQSLSYERVETIRREIEKSERATDIRFASVNEFRQELADRTQRFITREQYQGAHDVLVEKIDQFSARLTLIEGHATGRALTWRVVAGVIATAATIITVIVAIAAFVR